MAFRSTEHSTLRMFDIWNASLLEIANVKHVHNILDMYLKFILVKTQDKYYNDFKHNK
jgi:hypothetical protein